MAKTIWNVQDILNASALNENFNTGVYSSMIVHQVSSLNTVNVSSSSVFYNVASLQTTNVSSTSYNYNQSVTNVSSIATLHVSSGINLTENMTVTSSIGIDFSADNKGVFKGLNSIIYRMVNDESPGSQNPLGGGGSDWEVSDDTENEFYLGASGQVTETSGIFSFATTGYWSVRLICQLYQPAGATAGTMGGHIYSTDDNSTYSIISLAYTNLSTADGHGQTVAECLIKVSSTTLDKVKFTVAGGSTAYVQGNTAYNVTYATFTKLADL